MLIKKPIIGFGKPLPARPAGEYVLPARKQTENPLGPYHLARQMKKFVPRAGKKASGTVFPRIVIIDFICSPRKKHNGLAQIHHGPNARSQPRRPCATVG
jgi:hypothetical protein